jgi:predicted metal-dependent hydrolase
MKKYKTSLASSKINANQTYLDIPSYSMQNGYHKTSKQTKKNSQNWGGCTAKGTITLCWWECKVV